MARKEAETENIFENIVFSKNVIEFVLVSKEFCKWIENIETNKRKEFTSTCLKLLPLLYIKAAIIEKPQQLLDDCLNMYVTEDDYEVIRLKIKAILGQADDYLEVFHDDINLTETPIVASISENIADIYQDIKEFLQNYNSAISEIMNDALEEVINLFETHWGKCLTNVLRALHNVHYNIADGEVN